MVAVRSYFPDYCDSDDRDSGPVPVRPQLVVVRSSQRAVSRPGAVGPDAGTGRLRSLQGPGQPRLRSVDHSSRVSPATYRRRRLMVLGIVLLIVATAMALALWIAQSVGGGPLAAAGAGGASQASTRVWVVQPGQSLWSIASAVDPRGDVRPLVAQLAASSGSAAVYPGEQIRIP